MKNFFKNWFLTLPATAQAVLLVLKFLGFIHWSWWLVLAPLWLLIVLVASGVVALLSVDWDDYEDYDY